MVILHTNQGDITLDLDGENSPATVANFLRYVRDGHYDNTLFHRVIPGFMIQGGGFAPGMQQKTTRLRSRRSLRQHPFPPRDPGLHDPGWRLRARHAAEDDARAGCERSRQRREEC